MNSWLKIYFGCVLFIGLSPVKTLGQFQFVSDEYPGHEWEVFGDGFFGGSVKKKKNKFMIDANWLKSSWGLGLSCKLSLPNKNQKIQRISAEIKTLNGSGTRVYFGLSDQTKGQLIQRSTIAPGVSRDWQTFECFVADMKRDLFHSKDQRKRRQDHVNHQSVSLFFLKPKTAADSFRDTIIVRNLMIILEDGEAYAYQ